MSDALTHITLSTGHARLSSRDEVGDDIISMIRPLLGDAASGARVSVPAPTPGMEMTAAEEDGYLIATVWLAEAPLATFGVCPATAPDGGLALWQALHRLALDGGVSEPATRADTPPAAPWCAVVLLPALALVPDAAKWLGDFERCIAWTWLRG